MILIVLAALTPFVFIPGLQDPSGMPKAFFLSILAIGAVVLLRKKELIDFPLSLMVFIVAILLSVFWAINPHLYLSQLSLDLSGIALFLYTANCLKSKDLLMATVILCLVGTVITLSVFTGAQIDPRVSGPGWSVVNEKFFTLLLAGLVPLVIGLIHRSMMKAWIIVTPSYILVFSLMVSYIVVYQSLATYFAFGIIAVSACGLLAWKLLQQYSLIFSITVFSMIFVAILFSWIFNKHKLELVDIHERINWWEESRAMLVESNFLGVGRGQWQTQPHKRSPVHGDARHGWRPEHTHSDVMEILAETGLLGLGAFLAFLYTTLRLRTGRMGFWFKLSLLTFIFEGLFWSLLHYAIFVPFFWMIAGMVWVDRVEKEQFSGAGY